MPTALGLLILLVGGPLFLLGSINSLFAFCMLCTLMGGAAAINLGSTSILPTFVALGLLVLRELLPGARQMGNVRDGLRSNAMLIVFGAYALLTSIILPSIFRNQIQLVPLKAMPGKLTATDPLRPSLQNVTTPIYIMGTVVMALASFVASRQKDAWRLISLLAVVIVAVHCFFGIFGVALASTPFSLVIAFFRNGNYAQLEQNIGGIVRIAGIFPEPSAFASYGIAWFVFVTELWLRNVRTGLTGCAAFLMGAVLVASTSSTAYVGLGLYGIILLGRLLLFRNISFNKVLLIAIAAWIAIVGCMILILMYPQFAAKLGNVLRQSTLDKGESSSGQGRLMFAKQGFAAFFTSYGLGVGAGSFRSSSIATAILGSTGIIGTAAYFVYLVHVWKPLRRSTYEPVQSPSLRVGSAASWAFLIGTGSASVSASSPDPGTVMGLFAGIALGLRSATRSEPLRIEPSRHPAPAAPELA